ncbi:hypothetical protein F4775DRAFT_385326 [Biscogniauxia sp. FL1348]|nr:hypothetical protein F4775DRAFT_385326 [Biscogniauxia sp. FL1348]
MHLSNLDTLSYHIVSYVCVHSALAPSERRWLLLLGLLGHDPPYRRSPSSSYSVFRTWSRHGLWKMPKKRKDATSSQVPPWTANIVRSREGRSKRIPFLTNSLAHYLITYAVSARIRRNRIPLAPPIESRRGYGIWQIHHTLRDRQQEQHSKNRAPCRLRRPFPGYSDSHNIVGYSTATPLYYLGTTGRQVGRHTDRVGSPVARAVWWTCHC